MKRNILRRVIPTAAIVLAAAALTACPGGGAGGSTASVASRNLQEMPRLEAQLPASLAAGGSSSSSSIVAPRAAGDISELVAANLPDVKAQGWYDMKDAAGLDFMTEAFIEELKEIAEENTGLSFNTVYPVGDRQFIDGTYDMGSLRLTGTDNDMTVWWYANPSEPGLDVDFYARINIQREGGLAGSSDTWKVEANFTLFEADSSFGNTTAKLYMSFDTATGDSVRLSSFSGSSGGTPFEFNDITVSKRNSDNSLTVLSAFGDGGSLDGEVRIGWGDDAKGGVIGIGSWGGWSFASQEFYNGSGSLIKQSWGTSELFDDGISWVEDFGYNIRLAGITSPPDTLYVFHHNDGTTDKRILSTNTTRGDGDDVELPADKYDLYFKADTTVGGSWASGDARYDWSDGEWVESQSHYQETYSKGYVVPGATSFLGGSYYLEDRYPLKHLLPLTGTRFDGKKLMQLEGDTYQDTWSDPDSGESYDWSWTEYTYFIDMDGDRALDEFGSNPDVILDGVWMSENWIWDSANETEIVTKAPFYNTSGSLPSYFGFSQANKDIVTDVETRITTIYNNELSSLSVADYSSNLVDLSNATSYPQFDDLKP